MNAHPQDDGGVAGTVYVLHFEPAYRHAGHYVGWTAGDVEARIATHLQAPDHRSFALPSAPASTCSSSPPTPAVGCSSGA